MEWRRTRDAVYDLRFDLYVCVNKDFSKRKLRGKWNFDGYVCSDSGALDDIDQFHNYTKFKNETVALALRAGCDVESSS